ncbi:MAG: BlaI/MecI/CopY family transcriptional regulator [Flavonifractor plautii]
MARLTDSEWKVMEALWQGGPQTLGEVLARLAEDTGWSRTTVHTYLTRMMAKGLVAADAQSPRRYSAARSRESCVAEEERSLADRAYWRLRRGGAVAAFVRSGQLGREERAELRRLLDEMEV